MDIDAKIDKEKAILALHIAGYSDKYKLKELSDEKLIKLLNNHTKCMGVTITLHKPKIAKWIGDKCSNCGQERAWYGDNPAYCPDCGFKMEEDNE